MSSFTGIDASSIVALVGTAFVLTTWNAVLTRFLMPVGRRVPAWVAGQAAGTVVAVASVWFLNDGPGSNSSIGMFLVSPPASCIASFATPSCLALMDS